MGMHTLRHDDATYFADVVETVKAAAVRPQVHLTEAPAPRRIAPHAVAFSAEVVDPKNADDVLGTGRFVLLHDPASPEAWHGTWRIVTFARAELESEMATDPALGAVGWDWLLESLKDADATYSAEAGTVTMSSTRASAVSASAPPASNSRSVRHGRPTSRTSPRTCSAGRTSCAPSPVCPPFRKV